MSARSKCQGRRGAFWIKSAFRWYEELKHQYEVERSKLQENIESQARWMDEMKKVKEAAEDRVVKLEKELK